MGKAENAITTAQAALAMAGANKAKLSDITSYVTVPAVSNVYTLDLQGKPVKNFRIATGDTNAKAVVLANVPSGDFEIFIELTYTNAAAITWFNNIVWLSGSAPAFTVGKIYRIAFFGNGSNLHGNSVGGW